MAIGDAIRRATGPLVKRLVPQFGSTILIRDKKADSTTVAADNSETNIAGDWFTVVGGDKVPALLTVIALARTQNVWGLSPLMGKSWMITVGERITNRIQEKIISSCCRM